MFGERNPKTDPTISNTEPQRKTQWAKNLPKWDLTRPHPMGVSIQSIKALLGPTILYSPYLAGSQPQAGLMAARGLATHNANLGTELLDTSAYPLKYSPENGFI
jgi:hypothetical protein